MNIKSIFSSQGLVGDVLGGLSSMLVALPAAIAFGLVIYAPLGSAYTSFGALAGILGTIALGLITSLIGGTAGLISAPCAPAAAVLAAFVANIVKTEGIAPELVSAYLAIVILFAGLLQTLFSVLGGGKFIKYIPYSVVTGYLSGVGILIFLGQLPKLLGVPKEKILNALISPTMWNYPGLTVGAVTMATMFLAPRFIKKIPGAILALIMGMLTYGILTIWLPSLRTLENNGLVVGLIQIGESASIFSLALNSFNKLQLIQLNHLPILASTALTLAVLLSIDTLKTCVVLDVLTRSRHNSNRELFGQGIGNLAASILFGMPGAGTSGATLVNINSGGKAPRAGFFLGIFSLISFYAFLSYIAWVPVAALAGILIVIAFRMIDFKSFHLATQRSTIFDFSVILAVIITALVTNLIAAAGVGVALSILLFVRDQIHGTIIRRKSFGNAMFSKKQRSSDEFKMLHEKGDCTAIFELQGSLFFGTTDQFYSEIRPIIPKVKYVILDFDRVRSVDYTACNILKQIATQIEEGGGIFILSSIPEKKPGRQNVQRYFKEVGPFHDIKKKLEFATLDEALESVEDLILKEVGLITLETVLDLSEIKVFKTADGAIVDALKSVMREVHYNDGEKIFNSGDQSDEIYFIRHGNVRIQLLLPDGGLHSLSTFKKGDFFGDMSFLDHAVRSANAVASGDVSLYVLSRAEFDKCVAQRKDIAAVLFEGLSKAISHRLRQNNIELRSLRL
ncbi:MAG: SLC26A/SulP transporter family protein [Bdellovibrio sp.]|nr:SLC26A/SulP transporter family protein [Bdellovibrio sp.]